MLYEIFRFIGLVTGYPIQLIFFKRKIYYEDKKNTNLKKGGKLIISNHYNMLDYVNTSFIVFPRKLSAVTSEIPFKSKLLRFGMKFFGNIKADRENKNMDFIKKSANIIKKKQLVLIFPEGRNTPDGNIHEFTQSYIAISHLGNCPIVPIVSDGNYGIFKRVHIIIGKEIDISNFITTNKHLPTKEERKAINEYVFNKVLELRETLEQLKNKKRNKKNG